MTRSAEPRVLQFCHGYDGPFLDCARQYASLFAGTPYKVTTVFLTGRSDPEVAARCASDEVLFLEYGSRDIRGLKLKAIRDLPFRRLDFDDLFLDRKPGPMAPTLMFRREALEKVGGFDPDIRLEDVYIELAVTKAGYVIDILGEVLAQYRKHPTNTYKNARFMVDNVFKTYSQFSDHPDYEQVIMRFRNSMFLKCSNRDKVLARELLSGLPLKYWNEKTFRGIARLFFS